jgi:hypothetical protein
LRARQGAVDVALTVALLQRVRRRNGLASGVDVVEERIERINTVVGDGRRDVQLRRRGLLWCHLGRRSWQLLLLLLLLLALEYGIHIVEIIDHAVGKRIHIGGRGGHIVAVGVGSAGLHTHHSTTTTATTR